MNTLKNIGVGLALMVATVIAIGSVGFGFWWIVNSPYVKVIAYGAATVTVLAVAGMLGSGVRND